MRFEALCAWEAIITALEAGDKARAERMLPRFKIRVGTFLSTYWGHKTKTTTHRIPAGLEPLPVSIPFRGNPLHPLNILLDPQAYVFSVDVRDAYTKVATFEEVDAAVLNYADLPEDASPVEVAEFSKRSDAIDELRGVINSMLIPYLNSRTASRRLDTFKMPPTASPSSEIMAEVGDLLERNVDVITCPVPYVSFLSEVKTICVDLGAKPREYKPEKVLKSGRPRKDTPTLLEDIRWFYNTVREFPTKSTTAQITYRRAAHLYQRASAVLYRYNQTHGTSLAPINTLTASARKRAMLVENGETK